MWNIKGKQVVLTGGTSGIGKETSIRLAKAGAHLLLTTRNPDRGIAVKDTILDEAPGAQVQLVTCDLADLDSIRKAAVEILEKCPRIDILINNAGVFDFERMETKDGFERMFGVNFLAPFLLTELLLERIKSSSPARIINVASALHKGEIHFDNLQHTTAYKGMKVYAHSKLSMILWTRLLAKKLEGSEVTANVVHPGFIASNLGRSARWLSRFIFKTFGKSPEKGAETTFYVTSKPELGRVSGKYFANSKITQTTRQSYDMRSAEKLWYVASELTGLSKDG